uniref:Uncharacterized protein n=1 Tax=Erpetoichthys calabaricus TaxID=27687 RepID=A0A8C4RK63_ERPCA
LSTCAHLFRLRLWTAAAGTRDPLFLTGVSFPPDYPIGEETRLKLSVYDVREKSQETVSELRWRGSEGFSYSFLNEQFKEERELKGGLSKDFHVLSDFIFSSFFLVFKNPVCKVYRFQTADGQWMFIRELMAECTLSFNIPKQLINLFIQEDMQRIQDLKEMGELSPHWENLRKDMLGQYGQVISCYHDILTELNKITGPNFKPSCSKGEKYLEFIPINLHTQRMRVQYAAYDIITVGAPAAHFQGFKNGGLQRLMARFESDKKT